MIGNLLLSAAAALLASEGDPVTIAPETQFAERCQSFKYLDYSDTEGAPSKILEAEIMHVGEAQVCEIKGYTHPQSQFSIRIPMRNRNGRIYFQGCGGFCGIDNIDRANPALARGYVTVSTNMGHVGHPLDGLWAYKNPEAEIDFAHRATHRATIASKAIISDFLSQSPVLTLFHGCSTGGRQGLIAAQRYPRDYDVVIAGAPVTNYVRGAGLQLLWSNMVASGMAEGFGISVRDTKILAEYVLQKCDPIDAELDGVIADPRMCRVDWSASICSEEGQCLSEKAKRTAQAIYRGPIDALAGRGSRGPEFGSEPNWIGRYVASEGSEPLYLSFMKELLRYLAFAEDPGPNWQPRLEDLNSYYEQSEAAHSLYSPDPTKLSEFFSGGGKLLMYHGWRDQSVAPANTLDFLERMTLSPEYEAQLRAYMVPGLNHCLTGVGAHDVDWLTVMEQWIDTGHAPGSIIATDPARPLKTRSLRPYPSG